MMMSPITTTTHHRAGHRAGDYKVGVQEEFIYREHEKIIDEEQGHFRPHHEVAVGGGQKKCQAVA